MDSLKKVFNTFHTKYFSNRINTEFVCNLCGTSCKPYINYWSDIICIKCNSNIRSRLVAAVLQYHEPFSYMIVAWNRKVLHLSPERQLGAYLASRAREYDMADYDPTRYSRNCLHLDLSIRNQNFDDSSYDLIVAIDVLEHVPCLAAALTEIQRLLRPGGYFICSVPIPFGLQTTHDLEKKDLENPDMVQRLTGIRDHLRVFGNDFSSILESYFCNVFAISPSDITSSAASRHLLDNPYPSAIDPVLTRTRLVFIANLL